MVLKKADFVFVKVCKQNGGYGGEHGSIYVPISGEWWNLNLAGTPRGEKKIFQIIKNKFLFLQKVSIY